MITPSCGSAARTISEQQVVGELIPVWPTPRLLSREVHGPKPVPLALEIGHLAKRGIGDHGAPVQVVPPPGQGCGRRLDPPPVGGQRVLDRVDEPVEGRFVEDVRAQGLRQGPAGDVLDDRSRQDEFVLAYSGSLPGGAVGSGSIRNTLTAVGAFSAG